MSKIRATGNMLYVKNDEKSVSPHRYLSDEEKHPVGAEIVSVGDAVEKMFSPGQHILYDPSADFLANAGRYGFINSLHVVGITEDD